MNILISFASYHGLFLRFVHDDYNLIEARWVNPTRPASMLSAYRLIVFGQYCYPGCYASQSLIDRSLHIIACILLVSPDPVEDRGARLVGVVQHAPVCHTMGSNRDRASRRTLPHTQASRVVRVAPSLHRNSCLLVPEIQHDSGIHS